MKRKGEKETLLDTRSSPWDTNNPAAKSNGITFDTGLDFLGRFNCAGKTKGGFDDRRETQPERKSAGPFVALDVSRGADNIWVEAFAFLVTINNFKKGGFAEIISGDFGKTREFTYYKFAPCVISHKARAAHATV